MSLEDFLSYKRLASEQAEGPPPSEEPDERGSLQFSVLDPEKSGHVDWGDFLSHESILLLQRTRTQVPPGPGRSPGRLPRARGQPLPSLGPPGGRGGSAAGLSLTLPRSPPLRRTPCCAC